MTNKTVKSNLLVRVLLAICVFAFLVGGLMFVNNNNVVNAQESPVQATYTTGHVLELPTGTVNVNGTERAATAVLYYPNGVASIAKRQTLTQPGNYTLQYRVQVDGKVYTEEHNFTVYNSLYDGEGKTKLVYDQEKGGVVAEFIQGSSLTFNQMYNISNLTKNDKFLRFMALPETIGAREADSFIFTIVDAHDVDKYIRIRIHAADSIKDGDDRYKYTRTTSYSAVSFPGETWTGRSNSGALQTGYIYGREIRFSFSGEPAASPIGEDFGYINFDYSTYTLYASSETAPTYGGELVQLKSEDYFKKPFEGFTNGDVYISVEVEKFAVGATKATLLFTDIGGQKLVDKAILEDTTAPKINVDLAGFTKDNVPYGSVNNSYKVFTATASDDYTLNPEVKVTVYKNYTTPALRGIVPIVNGAFKPTSSGVYTIEYVSTDNFGNKGTELVNVRVVAQANTIKADVVLPTDLEQGDYIVIPQPEITSKEEFGKVNVFAELYFGKDKVELTDGKALALKGGDYTIKYTMSDYGGTTVSVEKTLKVASVSKSIIIDDVQNLLPKYFIAGNKFTLPTLNCYTFNNGDYVIEQCDIKIKDATEQVLNGDIYYPAVKNNRDVVSVIYEKAGTTKQYDIVCIKGMLTDGLHLENYFYSTSGVTAKGLYDGMDLTFANKNATVDFANALEASAIELTFKTYNKNNNFDGVTFTLTDSINPEQQIDVIFYKASAGSKMSINGGEQRNVSLGIDTKGIVLNVRNGRATVQGTSVIIEKYKNGEKFNGFDSGLVYLTISMKSCNSGSILRMITINNAYLDNELQDYAGPRVLLNGNIAYDQRINSVATIPTATAYDLTNGYLDVTVTVRFNKEILTAKDGTRLANAPANKEYQIDLANYGEYTITYASEDMFTNVGGLTRMIIVRDDVKPELKVNGVIVKEVALGGIVNLPKATVTDNMGGEYKVYVAIMDSSYKIIDGADNYSFTASKKGVWTVTYYTFDNAGNMAVAVYKINVI